MDPVLARVAQQQGRLISFLRELVECESPSGDTAAIGRFVELVTERTRDIASARTLKAGKFGQCLLLDFHLPGPKRKREGQILGVGHSDTVWPIGTLKTMPWREVDGRLWGPGVLDMKAGVAFFIYALRTLRELDIPVQRKVKLWLVPDEEVGSEGSRALTEAEAKQSHAVLVLEPGTGLEGRAKTARKGVGDYTVTVKGRAAHSGVDFSAGASAILEIARQIERIAGFTDLDKGITVNPGVIRGGTRTNVIAAEAQAEVDLRITKMKQAPVMNRKFHSLRPFDKRCTVIVEGGLNRPPMERTPGVLSLFRLAQKLAKDMGVKLDESSTGGGSDGNFTAGLGIPTLDGIGGVGEGAHAITESIVVSRVNDRAALLAKLVEAVSTQ